MGPVQPSGTGVPPPAEYSVRADLTLLHNKAQSALAEALMGEEPRLVVVGLSSSGLVATDTRAFVFKMGVRAGLPFGARLKEFEYDTVMRVDLRSAGEVDVVVIHAPLKISSCSSYWADQRDDAWKARNAVPVTLGSSSAKRSAERLSTLVHRYQARRTPGQDAAAKPTRPPAQATPNVVDRIAGREQTRTEIVPVPRDDQRTGAVTEECPRCGSELAVGWHFCPRCGAPSTFKRPGRAAPRRRRS